VYKPQAGERPLWDFPHGSLAHREVATYLVDAFLGWGLVPPTVLRDGPLGPGSVQLFVPHDPHRHYWVLLDEPRHRATLIRLAAFDLLINNADRKASHVLEAPGGSLVGIDHGLTFHAEPKLRTVIWELDGVEIRSGWRRDLARLAAALDDPGTALVDRLSGLLDPEEIEALGRRAGILRGLRRMPTIEPDRRPYPWPPL
jgi:uncharacterized repeat protein (TIGR03843 family)